jgi:hypothetical protein
MTRLFFEIINNAFIHTKINVKNMWELCSNYFHNKLKKYANYFAKIYDKFYNEFLNNTGLINHDE